VACLTMEFRDVVANKLRIAAVEGGGTAWKVAIAEDTPDNFVEQAEFRTTSNPAETLVQVRNWLKERTFHALGVASFGPVDLKPASPTFGFITSTPKPGWKNTDVLRLLGVYDEFAHIPYAFDTDVNAPAWSEFMHRENPESNSIAYITIGTGIGVGLVVNGLTVKGLLHPEAGHIFVKLLPEEKFCGSCPFHGSCVEGMCSTVALTARLNCSNEELPAIGDDHEVWSQTAYYIAQLCANLLLIVSPDKIVIGGGVMKRKILFPLIRERFVEVVNGYIQHPAITQAGVDNYITSSVWYVCLYVFGEFVVVWWL
jgi:fructokinase